MIKNISYSNTIVLYWDLPVNYVNGNVFLIMSEGEFVGKTDKFNFQVKNLENDSRYSFCVFMKHADGEEELIGECVCRTALQRKRIDISLPPYNAKGDGKTLNTECIQRAIDDCRGGECVYIPEGDFMSGALRLHSDMELYLEKGAVLHGTTEVKDYQPKIKSRFEGIEMMCYSSLLNIGVLERDNGFTCSNVRICGEGTVCGGGAELAENVIELESTLLKDYMESLGDKIKECESPRTIPGRPRPRLINISCAQNVLISGITVMNGSSWNVHMIYSDNVLTHGCTFRSEKVHNGDGWDPDSSSNCTIFGCNFYTGDDAVAVKSGKNPEGNVINIPSEHIRIFDCVSHFGHGITIGSEISGGINDVRIWNCDMKIAARGIEIKGTKKRGGYVKNVHVSHSSVARIMMHTVTYNDDGESAPTAPLFEKCTFENLRITAVMHEKDGRVERCEAIKIEGFDMDKHLIKDIRFKNIDIESDEMQTIYLKYCKGVSFENISTK